MQAFYFEKIQVLGKNFILGGERFETVVDM